MKAPMVKLLIAVALCLSFLAFDRAWAAANNIPPDIAAIQQRGVLRVAMYPDSADIQKDPTTWIGVEGVEVDLCTLIATQLGVKLMIVPASTYDNIIDMVASGQADLGAALGILPQRALRVAFTHPYDTYNPHLLVNRLQAAKNNWNGQNQIIQGIESGKAPLKIGVLKDSASGPLIEQNFPKATIIPYDNMQTAFQDVITGKIFAAMSTAPAEVQNFINTNTKASLLAEDINAPQLTLLISMALPWQDFHLRELLNSYLDYLKQNGILQQILIKNGEVSS